MPSGLRRVTSGLAIYNSGSLMIVGAEGYDPKPKSTRVWGNKKNIPEDEELVDQAAFNYGCGTPYLPSNKFYGRTSES